MQINLAQAQSDWSGWYHCDIQDHDYDGPGTRYFCRPVSWDWICNIARITSLCNNRSGRNSRRDGDDSGGGAGSSGVDIASRSAPNAYKPMNIRRIDSAGVGIQSIIDAGFIDAIDVWGGDVKGEVCLTGVGRLLFLDAGSSPRAQSWLDSFQRDGRTCAVLDRAGTVVLLSGVAPARDRDDRVCTTGNLRVRAAPSLKADTIGFLRQGTSLSALTRSGNWIEIEFEGIRGWIGVGYVSEGGGCGEKGDPQAAARDGGERICTTGNLRVRAAPSLKADTIGFLRRGTSLSALTRSGNWIEIEFEGTRGWIGVGYVNEGDGCGEKGDPQAAAHDGGERICTTGNLRVRVAPSLKADTIGFLRRGTSLSALTRSGNWIEIEFEGTKGWTGVGYVSEGGSCGEKGDPQAAAARDGDDRICTMGNLRVRAAPSLKADTIGFLRRGVNVRTVSRSNDWIEIDYLGAAGWIGSGFAVEGGDCG